MSRCFTFLITALCWLLLTQHHVRHCNASIFGRRGSGRVGLQYAAIFGFGSKNEGEDDDNSRSQPFQHMSPPPPPDGQHQQQQQRIQMQQWQKRKQPPPPPPTGEESAEQKSEQDDGEASTEHVSSEENAAIVRPPLTAFPPPPAGGAWPTGPDAGFGWIDNSQASPWPTMDGAGGPSSRGHVDPAAQADHFRILQLDLEASIQREHDLVSRLHNASETMAAMEQREELHVRQLDVLTERVIEVEAQAATDHNQLLEYQANCSILDLEIAELKGQVEDWKRRCLESDDRNKKLLADQKQLIKKVEKSNRDAERLATKVENHRLDEVRAVYAHKKKQARPFGVIGWFLGWHKRDDEELEELRDAAKSTLLNALKTERTNVEELESAVTSLEQNNTAIALQIQSRDEIIDELNERVAVFEEDKVVLKAALQQLRKDMLEEAPKTQQLVDELAEARVEIQRLEDEIESTSAAQKQTVGSLEIMISEKQDQILQAESNVTMIGEYVDKLEERLADFALARRDIDRREQACAEMEKKTQLIESECATLRESIASNEKEQKELKSLLEEMVADRTNLQERITHLSAEKDEARTEVTNLLQSIDSLQAEVSSLQHQSQQQQDHLQQQQEYHQQELQRQLQSFQQQQRQQQNYPPPNEWGAHAQEYERRISVLIDENNQLKHTGEQSQVKLADLQTTLDEMASTRQQLEQLLSEAQSTKASLEENLNSALESQRLVEERLQKQEIQYQQRLSKMETEAQSWKASLEEKISQHQKEVELAKHQAELTLTEEKEMFVARLAEEKENQERQMAQIKQQLEVLMKEEHEQFESKLAVERQKVETLLSEGEQNATEQMQLLLNAERESFDVKLKEEREKAQSVLKEQQEKMTDQHKLELEEEKEKFENELATEKQRLETVLAQAEQKSADQLHLELEKISQADKAKEALLEEQRLKFESQLVLERERFEKLLKEKDMASRRRQESVRLATDKAVKEAAPKSGKPPPIVSNTTARPSNITAPANRTMAPTPLNRTVLGNSTRMPPRGPRPPIKRMPPKKKSVARSIRKVFAVATGLHGFFSKKYQRPPPQKRPPPPLGPVNGTAPKNARGKEPPGRRLPGDQPPTFAVRSGVGKVPPGATRPQTQNPTGKQAATSSKQKDIPPQLATPSNKPDQNKK